MLQIEISMSRSKLKYARADVGRCPFLFGPESSVSSVISVAKNFFEEEI